MAPKGQNTGVCRLLAVLGAMLLVVIPIIFIASHNGFLAALNSCALSDCTASPSQAKHHLQNKEDPSQQRNAATIYSDLALLDELPQANVLWVNGTEKPEAWGISMFHGLHCIKMWKDSLDPATAMKDHVHSQNEYAEHSQHCISYLVQAIACFADGTIEPAELITQDGRHGRRIHGMGYMHQCRDPSLLFKMNGEIVPSWGWRQGDTIQSVFGS